jgi:hypothetical protein
MSNFVRFISLVAALLVAPMAAQAKARISVDLSSQRMEVQSDSGASYSWRISSARAGYVTPRGTYHPTSLQTMHRSKKYHNSPMPHSIFFNGGYAIHGTYAVGALGSPASHGCIRISPANAATLFSLVRAEGAVIEIHGSAPIRHYAHAAHRHHKHVAQLHHHHIESDALGYAPLHHNDGLKHIFGNILPE